MSEKKSQHTTNYYNTFIETSDDSNATAGEMPALKDDKKTVAGLQYEILTGHPYQYTSDDVLFQVFAERNNFPETSYSDERERFFSKGQPCFRASPLTKKYGFGIHSDSKGKIALYGINTKEYTAFLKDESVKKIKAMRSSKK